LAALGGPFGLLIMWFRSQQAAMENNTEAVNQNTAVLKPGVYGSGPRSQGAVPSGRAMNAQAWRAATDAGTMGLGGF
jgi:hypothetical protein